MQGIPRSLSRVDAEVVGRWGAKTTFMFQAMEPKADRVIDEAFYPPLYSAAVLPPTVRVWAASVKAQGVFSHAFGGDLEIGKQRESMFISLLALDRLALMTMGCPNPGLMQSFKLGHLSNAWKEVGAIGKSVKWPGSFIFEANNFMAMPELLEKLASGLPQP